MPKPYKPTMTEAFNGKIYRADGVNKVMRRDGYTSWEETGVVQPAIDSVTLTGDTGTFLSHNFYVTAQCRAEDGRVGNAAIISGPHGTLADIDQGVITQIQPPNNIWDQLNTYGECVITSPGHELTTGRRVDLRDVIRRPLTNGSYDSVFTITVLDEDRFTIYKTQNHRWECYPKAYQPNSGLWYIGYNSFSIQITIPGGLTVRYLDVYRTKTNGTADVYYKITTLNISPSLEPQTVSLTATQYTDEDLTDELALQGLDGTDLNATRHGLPPDHKTVVVQHASRLWMAVDRAYKRGVTSMSVGAEEVVGRNVEWSPQMVGRQFYPRNFSGTPQDYVVETVEDSTNLTLDAEYLGWPDPFMRYTIRNPTEERNTLYFSEAGLPESFDHTKTLTIREDEGLGEMTALMPFRDNMYVLYEKGIYRLNYSVRPDLDGIIKVVAWRGCVNQKCWVTAEGESYLLDYKGIYRFDGNNTQTISDPIQPLFARNKRSRFKVQYQYAENFHAVHDPHEEVVKFFVSMDGNAYPRHAIVFHYRHNRWWIEEYSVPISASCLGDMGSKPQVYLAVPNRQVIATGFGDSDGAESRNGTVAGTVTAATFMTLSDSSASFSSTFSGHPVILVDGKGRGQKRTIVDVDGTKLFVDRPWGILPDTTTTYQVGGIDYKYRTGWFPLVHDDMKQERGVSLTFQPQTNSSTMRVRVFRDDLEEGRENAVVWKDDEGINGMTPEYEGDFLYVNVNRKNGWCYHGNNGGRNDNSAGPRHMSVELSGITNEEQHKVRRVGIHGAEK